VKKASLAILLFMSGVTVVFAAGSPGSPGAPCPSTGDSTQIFGKTVLSCVDGKWKLDGHAPASVIFTVQMLSGQKHLLDRLARQTSPFMGRKDSAKMEL